MNAQPNDAPTVVSDWIPAAVLADLVGSDVKTVYNQHCCGRGPLAPILTKLGGRLGCWREDYDAWKAQQRRLPGGEPQGASARAQSAVTPPAADSHTSRGAAAASKARPRTTTAKSRRVHRR